MASRLPFRVPPLATSWRPAYHLGIGALRPLGAPGPDGSGGSGGYTDMTTLPRTTFAALAVPMFQLLVAGTAAGYSSARGAGSLDGWVDVRGDTTASPPRRRFRGRTARRPGTGRAPESPQRVLGEGICTPVASGGSDIRGEFERRREVVTTFPSGGHPGVPSRIRSATASPAPVRAGSTGSSLAAEPRAWTGAGTDFVDGTPYEARGLGPS